MTPVQFEAALRGFCRRRPFHNFLIEFNSGNVMHVSHPEAIGQKAGAFLLRCPDGGYVISPAERVSRLLDMTPVSAV